MSFVFEMGVLMRKRAYDERDFSDIQVILDQIDNEKRHAFNMQADAIMRMHENDVEYWTGVLAAYDKVERMIFSQGIM